MDVWPKTISGDRRQALLIGTAPRVSENGSALVGAILLLLLLSMIGVSGADQALLQERMASNQHVQVNSFSAAEAGLIQAKQIADSQQIRDAIKSGDNSEIEARWANLIEQYEGWNELSSASATQFRISKAAGEDSYWDPVRKRFRVNSTGRVPRGSGKVATRVVGADIASKITAGSENRFPFQSGVVGIDGMSLSGGPQINTYNSNYGDYGEEVTVDGETFTNIHEDGDNPQFEGTTARTCRQGANVSLSGNSPVYGDLISTGNLEMRGQTPVYGDVRVNGNAFLENNSDELNGHVYGDLVVRGNVVLGSAGIVEGDALIGGDFESSGRVGGSVTVDGDATFSNSSTTGGHVTAGGEVVVGSTNNPPPSVTAGGAIDHPSWWQHDDQLSAILENYQGNQSELEIPEIDPIDGSELDCEPLDVRDPETGNLSELFTNVLGDPRTVALAGWFDSQDCAYCYSQSDGFVLTGGQGDQDAANTVIGTAGEETLLRVDNDISNAGALEKLTIRGHVSLVVEGDFELSGGTSLNVEADSTLTLLITGRTRLGGGSDLLTEDNFVREGPDGESRPAVVVYSAYNQYGGSGSNAGVVIDGSSDASIAVYAPETNVAITGSGDIFGSLVAGNIEMSGSGDIHFDEALRDVGEGGESGAGTTVGQARIVSWWQEVGS